MIEVTEAERRLEITEIEADSQKLEWLRDTLAAANAKIGSLVAELGDQQAYEDLRAERDALSRLCAAMLATFQEPGHPGRPCHRSGWIDDSAIAGWHQTYRKATP